MKDRVFEELKTELTGVKKDISLKDYITFKIGGSARYFFIARDIEDLTRALKIAKKLKLPVFVLGGGSNILVSDKGYNGLVIQIQNVKIKIQNFNKVYADAGVALSKLAGFAAKNGFAGLEWAVGIPGATVGGAVFGHAQAFGEKISDHLKSVEALDAKTLKIKNFSKKQCQFSVKNSIFKSASRRNKNLIIVSAKFCFKRGNKDKIKEKSKKFLNYRKKNHPTAFPSAGSMFVNPEIKNKKLFERFPELLEYSKIGVVRSGYLIEKAGLKGKKIGGAQISEQHANFIVNLGGAKAKDVLALIKLAQKKVKKTFGVLLEPEVRMIGF